MLGNLKLDMSDVQTDLVYPRNLPDLFRGSQLTLIGRYRNPSDMTNVRLLLSGLGSGKERSFFYNELRFPLRDEKNDFLPRLWATRRVGWLMEQIRTNGENQELRDEIVDLGTRYGIVTPYTSYLALEPGAGQPITSGPVNGRRPTGVFGGLSGVSPADAPRPKSTDSVTVVSALPDLNAGATQSSGAGAVAQSKRARAQQESTVLEKDKLSSAVQRVGRKTFYLRDDGWTDGEYKAEAKLPETSIVFGTDEYFALLKEKPALSEFFALGEKVVVVFEGRVYRVTAAKP